MYGYARNIPLSMNDFLAIYSQEDIFRIIFGDYPDLDILYLSPFREDYHPNCFFEWYKGKLMFRDFGDIRRDCFQGIKDLYGIGTYSEVMEFIDNYFSDNPIPLDQKPKRICNKERKDCSITFRIKDYETKDNLYWKQYFITPSQLREDQVSVINWYRFYSEKAKKWIILRPYDIAYAISGFETRCKIYRPLNHNKKSKWLTNCKANDVGNLANIDPTGEVLIITKSYKDHRVIRNQGFKNVIWFQAEKIMPDDSILLSLLQRYERILIFYDNDDAGICGSADLQHKLESFDFIKRPIMTMYSPCNYLKDPAEIVSIRSEQELKSLLEENIYLLKKYIF